jgi:hypothetical protein
VIQLQAAAARRFAEVGVHSLAIPRTDARTVPGSRTDVASFALPMRYLKTAFIITAAPLLHDFHTRQHGRSVVQ